MRRSRVQRAKCRHCRQRVRSGAGSYCWACGRCVQCCRCLIAVELLPPLPLPRPLAPVSRGAGWERDERAA